MFTALPTRIRASQMPGRRAPTAAWRAVIAVILMNLAVGRVCAQTATWTGAGGDNNWNNALNWTGYTAPLAAFLEFGSSTTTTLNNDVIPTFTFYGDITFLAGASAYTLTGNLISIDAYGTTQSITNNAVNVTQTLNLPIVLQRSATVNAAAGNIVIGGIISGANNLTKTGASALTLSGVNTFTGTLLVSNGTVRATTSASALGAGTGTGSVTLAGGSLELANNTGLAFNRNITVSSNTTITSDRLTSGAGVTHTLGTLGIGAQTMSVEKGSFVTGGTAGLTFGATTLSASGAVFDVGSGAGLTLASVSGNTHSFTVQGAGNTTISGAISTSSGTLTKGGTGTLTLSGTNSFTGTAAVNGGTLVLDYASSNGSKLSNTAALTLSGGTINLLGGSHTEVVLSTSIATGASAVTRTGGSSTLRLNAITRTAGGTIDFGAASIATTDTTNTNGILGAWATVGGTNYAVNSTNGGDGAITALSTFTDVTRLSSGLKVIANNAANNVRITDGTGTAANITLGASTTVINTLTNSATGGTSVIDLAGQTLRVGGILEGAGAGGLTIGAGSNNGTLTAATTSGELVIHNFSTNSLTINSVIANNTGTTALTKAGTGTLLLTGANTYTGTTTVSGGTLTAGANGALGATTGIIVDSGGTLLLAGTSGTRVSNTAGITLDGGTLSTAGLSNATETLGSLTLSADSTLDFGTGSGDQLIFSGVGTHSAGTTLSILNYSTNSDHLVFTGTAADFTSVYAQADVSFSGFSSGYAAVSFGTGQFEIVAVPEPATLFGALAVVGLVGYRERRRFTVLFRR